MVSDNELIPPVYSAASCGLRPEASESDEAGGRGSWCFLDILYRT